MALEVDARAGGRYRGAACLHTRSVVACLHTRDVAAFVNMCVVCVFLQEELGVYMLNLCGMSVCANVSSFFIWELKGK